MKFGTLALDVQPLNIATAATESNLTKCIPGMHLDLETVILYCKMVVPEYVKGNHRQKSSNRSSV